MNRAYSLLTLKAVDEDARIITGMATTPTPDRLQDVVEPRGAQFKLPIPFLWQHDPVSRSATSPTPRSASPASRSSPRSPRA